MTKIIFRFLLFLLELVEVEAALVEVEAGAEDGVGDLGCVLELGRKPADLVTHVQDVLGEKPEK